MHRENALLLLLTVALTFRHVSRHRKNAGKDRIHQGWIDSLLGKWPSKLGNELLRSEFEVKKGSRFIHG